MPLLLVLSFALFQGVWNARALAHHQITRFQLLVVTLNAFWVSFGSMHELLTFGFGVVIWAHKVCVGRKRCVRAIIYHPVLLDRRSQAFWLPL
jgi:sensor domain CHASE-containing protein